MQVEWFFDFSCPYAYLGSSRIEEIAGNSGAELIWRPFLLGGVFRALGTPQHLAISQPASKTQHGTVDMQRWARHFKVPLRMPSAHPMKTVRALRALLSLPKEHWSAFIQRVFQLYWEEGQAVDDPLVLRRAMFALDVPAREIDAAIAANDSEEIRQALRGRTQEAIDRGVFGAPTAFLQAADTEEPFMLWGQDRLDLLKAYLAGWRPGDVASLPPLAPSPPRETRRELDFWFDLASPFAYLGFAQVQGLCADIGARLRLRPLLLGGLFRDIGTANVPIQAMSAPKRRYLMQELEVFSSRLDLAFRFSPHFPIRTVTPLRLLVACAHRYPEATFSLASALFLATWSEGKDTSSQEVLLQLLEKLDLATLMDDCNTPEIKEELKRNGEEAQKLGVFGVPTFVVRENQRQELYWGQDRVGLIRREWT